MTEIKTFYNIANFDIREINFVLGQIANRLDALEGLRGTPKFYSAVDMDSNKITNVEDATEDQDALTKTSLDQYVLSDGTRDIDFSSGDWRVGNVTGGTDVEIDSSGNLIASGMLRQGEIWHAYGGFQGASETISISTVDVWYHITNAGNNLWTGLEADGLTISSDIMTVTNAGDYVGTLSMSMTGLAGKDFQIRCYNITQATQMGYVIGASTDGAGNFTVATLPLYIECNAGDTLRMEVRCITDASDPTFKNAVFYLAYLHD